MLKKITIILIFYILSVYGFCFADSSGSTIESIKKRGYIRHLGVPYAKFVTGAGDGLSVDLVKGFAVELNIEYRFVQTSFQDIIADLTGLDISTGKKINSPKGDIIATGFTVLDWRKKYVDFADPVFPTQVWLIAKSELPIKPIVPKNDLNKDIDAVKSLLPNISLLGIKGTCLDPDLYEIKKTGADIKIFNGSVNDLAPAVLNNEAETTLLDVADTLIALRKWPGKIKVIGPIGPKQVMAPAFRKDSKDLKNEYNKYLKKICKNGTYKRLVRKYYPDVFSYYPEFFSKCN